MSLQGAKLTRLRDLLNEMRTMDDVEAGNWSDVIVDCLIDIDKAIEEERKAT